MAVAAAGIYSFPSSASPHHLALDRPPTRSIVNAQPQAPGRLKSPIESIRAVLFSGQKTQPGMSTEV
ncbi:hypothetical protein EYF80_018376 [Liparis tanakae]|uniref:Uncharacterized protein n=1 Tax=Liparis tanakae TaxID=230148 RepID=A0A4Z2I0D9_9TELE|nr:hypothetical protein EYF80_018376 [Liparis tanakae]